MNENVALLLVAPLMLLTVFFAFAMVMSIISGQWLLAVVMFVGLVICAWIWHKCLKVLI